MNIDRDRIQLQTISNLVAAGVLKKEEAEFYNKKLSGLTWGEAAEVLVVSHHLRENCPNPIDYYPIGEIGKN